jgi:dienelactone hydrolase
MSLWLQSLCLALLIITSIQPTLAQQKAKASGNAKKKESPPEPPSVPVIKSLTETRDQLRSVLEEARKNPIVETVDGERWLADVAVFEKAATWMLRFNEFPKADYVDQLKSVILKGEARAKELASGEVSWETQTGITILGYQSRVDGTYQPYALTLPDGVNPKDAKRWPLHVVLHGRADQMNEVNFIHRMDGKPFKKEEGAPDLAWIQLDVYGRGNNAYRFAGETDVFEAMADVKRRFRIDEDRITLHGFSMGGAGAWHLGLHHPSVWSSVGPGAGFVDYYRYQKKNPDDPAQRLADVPNRTLAIYDTVNYALNAFNVPVCTYGGEEDPQLLASTTMSDAAAVFDVPIKVIIGPKMGHKFDPQSLKEFMSFHLEKSATGRPRFGERKEIRFSTHTLRYNECDWISIEEVDAVYEPSTVEAKVNDAGDVEIITSNVAALKLSRETGTDVILEGTTLDCRMAADGLLPDVYYVRTGDEWTVLDYDESRGFADNAEVHKRHGLQGPIDDAFMDSFVCVRGEGTPWNAAAGKWSDATLEQFQTEFAQWMRGEVRMVEPEAVDDDLVARNHLVLFGDPGSNPLIEKVLGGLPIKWTKDTITIGDQSWSAKDHGVCLIFPNPMNRSKYVVLNSGHTFHAKEFQSTNANLFPRLGDIAVQKITDGASGKAEDVPVWSGIFNSRWQL